MIYSFEDILDYTKCPMLYFLKYEKGIKPEVNLSIYDEFNNALKKTIQYFYYRIMEGTIVGTDEIKSKWEKHFSIEDGSHIFDQYTQPAHHGNPNLREKQKRRKMLYEGWGLVSKFHNMHRENPGVPVAIDIEHGINVGEYHIKGTIDLVRLINEKVEVIGIRPKKKVPTDFEIRNDMSLTFQTMLFRDLFEKQEDLISYYLIDHNQVVNTNRSNTDFKKLKKIISNICYCIENNIYYPKYTALCYNCYLQDACTKWEGV